MPALLLLVLIAAFGCGKRESREAAPGASPPPQKSNVSLDSLVKPDEATPPPAPAAPAAAAPEPQAKTEEPAPVPTGGPPAELAAGQMSMFVQQFFYEFHRLPNDVKELVRPNYLPYVYPPPAGKKWVIDKNTKTVKLADK
ncbi:MAG: hypothetical protein HY300_11115 [Verrucomicrobia bacterium]|nr:hypothetical protein [Verrucomicrobiota bacterium]